MKGMHARLPKGFVLEEQLERYGRVIEVAPVSLRGRWREACWPAGAAGGFSALHLDMGCGKGAFLAEAAARDPEALYVGVDAEPICVAYAARAVSEAGVANAVVVPAMGDALPRIFAPGEVDVIHLNFPTPFPRKKEAALRLTAYERLMEYRELLAPKGILRLRSDSAPFVAWSRVQLANAGFSLTWESSDARAERPDEPYTGYEKRLAAQGACVYGIDACVGELPAEKIEVPLSLAEFLPSDLESVGYVPLGMRATVENLRNRARRHG